MWVEVFYTIFENSFFTRYGDIQGSHIILLFHFVLWYHCVFCMSLETDKDCLEQIEHRPSLRRLWDIHKVQKTFLRHPVITGLSVIATKASWSISLDSFTVTLKPPSIFFFYFIDMTNWFNLVCFFSCFFWHD